MMKSMTKKVVLGASSSGRTVNVTIAWQIGWDAAVPMVENIIVK